MRIILAALVLTLSASAAVADTKPTPDAAKMVTDDCARATKLGKKCVMNMDNEQVGGETPGATGSTVGILKFGDHSSLIRIRRDFITEIIKTAEDL
ncbi:MAG: hypothetical protein H0T79_06185 [Deltaproteobacteria bacterium]|nr:hypothetical protein [Deltaproteobacteria bacterium]